MTKTINPNVKPWIWVFIFIVLVGILIIFSGCSELRPYKQVASDYPRSQEKRTLLAPVCKIEFPVEKGKDSSSTSTTIIVKDTSANAGLRDKIAELAAQLAQRPDCPQINSDSLYEAIKAQIKPEVHTVTNTVRVVETEIDSAGIVVLQTQYAQLQFDYTQKVNEGKEKDLKIAKQEQDIKDARRWMLYFAILAFVVAGYIVLRIIKKVP